MEIIEDNSTPEYPHIYFNGEMDSCALALNTQKTWLRFYIGSTLDEHILLSQNDIKAILPYLQSFAEQGTLEPQESPLARGRWEDCRDRYNRRSQEED